MFKTIYTRVSLFSLFILFACLMAVAQSPSPAPRPKPTPPCRFCPAPPKQLAYHLKVQRVGSGDIIEFMPMTIKWTLDVTQFGISGPDPEAIDVSISPVIGTNDPQFVNAEIKNAAPGRIYRGTMIVPAPPAGKQSPLRVVVLKPVTDVQRAAIGEATLNVDTAARYEIGISEFDLLTTRSNSTDTVWITLQGIVKATPAHPSDGPDACRLAGFKWCVFNQKYGDVHNSGVRVVDNVRVRTYDLVPGRERDLRFVFYLDNHNDNTTASTFSLASIRFANAAQAILDGIGAGRHSPEPSFAGLDFAMEQLHSDQVGSCDGKLAEDTVVIANTTLANQPENTLDGFTRATGYYTSYVMSNGAPKVYHYTDGDAICDRRGGQYRVAYKIRRVSWQPWGFQPQW